MQLGTTGEGYVYLRSRARGEDVTVYLHQLAAIRAGYSVDEVFDSETEVHHRWPVKDLNEPWNVEVVSVDEHNDLDGAPPDRPPLPSLEEGSA